MAIKELKLDLIAKIKKPDFQVRRRMLSKLIEGELATSFKGRGMEFTGFRKYIYGDDASQIDWSATLRAKTTLIREFEEYRNFQIFVLFDVSNSMLFSSTEVLKCEYAAELVFSIVYSIVNAGNKIGVGMFTDKLVTRQVPQNSAENYFRILNDLMNPKNYGGNFGIKKPLMQVRTLLKGKSLLIIVSDFIGLEKEWYKYLNLVTEDFEVLGIMIRDPRDEELPNTTGQYMVEDPYSGENMLIDTKDYYKIYKETVQKEKEDIRSKFHQKKAGFISIRTDQDFMNPLLKYISIRSKMIAKLE